MTKTPVTYKETLQGILTVREIESIVMDNLINVQKYLFRNYQNLSINQRTIKHLHKLLTANLFEEGGNYRKHNVELGSFEPPTYFKVPQYMMDWEEDYKERRKHTRTQEQKIELCAWLIHRFLWIHPFFDYNGRISRLIGELFLLKNKFPVVTFQSVKRVDFVRAVKKATECGDLNDLSGLIKGE
ncbi:Fic family protein [Candidatus Uhrbacteria bacterium]|nr:Fic family protein [Candidatus Uhrbacteria bacterium]